MEVIEVLSFFLSFSSHHHPGVGLLYSTPRLLVLHIIRGMDQGELSGGVYLEGRSGRVMISRWWPPRSKRVDVASRFLSNFALALYSRQYCS